MSITPLSKITLVGKLARKAELLESLQLFGGLHLDETIIQTYAHKTLSQTEHGDRVRDQYDQAIDFLQKVVHKRKSLSPTLNQDPLHLIEVILKNKESLQQVVDARDDLMAKREDLAMWGEFRIPDRSELGGNRFWFYLLPKKFEKQLSELKLPWKIVFSDHQKIWLVIVNPQEPKEALLPVRHLKIGLESHQEVLEKLRNLEVRLEELDSQRQGFTRYLDFLIEKRNQIYDRSELLRASGMSVDNEHLFVQKAWIPSARVSELTQLSKELGFAVFVEPVSEVDMPPTLLTNPTQLQGGEMLVGFYQMPAYKSWDPSLILFASFSIFFAMILSDAGYSMVLASLLLMSWRKISKSGIGRKLLPLIASVIACSFMWGVLVGSYFGVSPTYPVLAKLHVLNVNDFHSMMFLSIGCGVVHIVFANAYQIMVGWGTHNAYKHLGWIIVLLSAVGFGLVNKSQQILYSFLIGSFIFGMSVVFVSASNRKVQSIQDFFFRCLDGLNALTNVTSLFGDILSYLRLFALGLASSSLALTFNQLATNAFHSDSSLGILSGILILLIGHVLNLVLGIVSGVVHSLRLNYIEFYKWALYGEGYPFKAFKKLGVSK